MGALDPSPLSPEYRAEGRNNNDQRDSVLAAHFGWMASAIFLAWSTENWPVMSA